MKRPRISVTDHAVVRYLERVEGMDVERLRIEIGRIVERAAGLGANGVIVDGYRYVLADQAVTTVLTASKPDPRTGRKRPRSGT